MQTREMWNRTRWTVVGGAAALTALGVTGLALAETDDDNLPAEGITLEDLQTVDTFDSPDLVTVDTGGVLSDLDSPLDDGAGGVAGTDSPDDSPAGVAGTDSPDSPDDAAAGVAGTDSPDSPDDAAAGVGDSPESPDSPDD